MKLDVIKVFCDGGSRGNPGPAAAGVVMLDQKDQIIGEYNKYLGIATNNYAEYNAVVLAFEKLPQFKPTRVEFYLDSELVVRQLSGRYRVKHDSLKPLHQEILEKAQHYDVSFSHVLRANNKLADRQVNICLDEHAKS